MFSVEAPALAFFLGQLDEAEISRGNERFDQVDDYISNFGFYAVIHQDNTKRQGNIFLVNVNFFCMYLCIMYVLT